MIVLIVTWCSLLLLITTRSATLVICHASILLLGTKDVGKSIKNSIHLFGQSAELLLCFSVVMVMGDNHKDGLEFGSEMGWIVKSVPGVLPSWPGYHTCGNIKGKEKNSQKGKGKRGEKGNFLRFISIVILPMIKKI